MMKKYSVTFGFTSALLIFASAVILLLLTAASEAQESQKQDAAAAPFNAVEARQAVENLAKQLEENFIYPNIGKAYAAMLRSKIASGAYSEFSSAEEFARTVTRDLQAVHPEGHLKLQPPTAKASVSGGAGVSARINGVGKFGWLTPKTAYLSYHGFSGNRAEYDKVLNKLREVLDGFSAAETLIIDARSHPGGGLDDMDVMFSYFFDKPIRVVMMDTRFEVDQRDANPLSGHPTLQKVEGPEGIVRRAHLVNPSNKNTSLNKARIFLLTSSKTASAGEHLALALKRTKRATLIGEKTAGAGHFGRTTALGGGYRAFIPVGRTFDPDTDKGWEQTGVEPHIKVSAEKAFEEASKRAGINRDKAKKALESFTLN